MVTGKYRQQRNELVAMLRRTKLHYYKHLDTHDLTDNKKFWKTVKPIFTDKIQTSQFINLLEKGEIINDDITIAEAFNEYFANIIDERELTEKNPTTHFQKLLKTPLIMHFKTIRTIQA